MPVSTLFLLTSISSFELLTPTLPFRPAKQVSAAGTSLTQRKLRFAPTSPADADAGGSSADLGPRQPEATTREGSATPEPTDHRADAGTPASNDQGHDAGRSGVETEGQAERPQAQPTTQEVVVPSPPRAAPAPAAPTRATGPLAAPLPTPVPLPSAAATNLQRPPPAKITAPAQGTSSTP